jgi:beta-galactosidase
MVSRMYPSPRTLELLAGHEISQRPVMMCEYAHAMGNSLGNFQEYWDVIRSHDRLIGGFIWDFIDQGLYKTNGDGRRYFAYGGDFGDRAGDGNFCINGIVSADRRPKPQIIEAKRVMQPVEFNMQDPGVRRVEISNRHHFRDLNELDIIWEITEDGQTTRSGTLDPLNLAPGQSTTVTFPAPEVEQAGKGSEYFLNIKVVLREECSWTGAGHAVAEVQFPLPVNTGTAAVPPPAGSLNLEEEKEILTVKGDGFSLTVDKATGDITRYTYHDEVLISGNLHPNFWRAQTDNDRRGWRTHMRLKYWKDCTTGDTHAGITSGQSDVGSVLISVERTLPEGKARLSTRYRVFPNGWIRVWHAFDPVDELPVLPRFGLQGTIPGEYRSITYLGKGPHENYADRQVSADVGLYASSVEAFGEPYVFPQEHANRTGVRWMAFLDSRGSGLVITADSLLSMSAWPNSQEAIEAARHTVELPDEDHITVNIDLVQMGVGGNDTWSNNSMPLLQYLVQPVPMEYSFWIKPYSPEEGNIGKFGRLALEVQQ